MISLWSLWDEWRGEEMLNYNKPAKIEKNIKY